MALRAQAQAARLPVSSCPTPTAPLPAHLPERETAAAPSLQLSWEMRNALNALQQRRPADSGRVAPVSLPPILVPENMTTTAVPASFPDVASSPDDKNAPTVKIWPVLGAALAAADLAPAHRFYLACQAIDPDGRRAFDLAAVRATFTQAENGRYLFSWRRMRQVLAQGRGKLWDIDRNTNRLYLRSIARIAALLGLTGIGRGVLLPSDLLFQGQGVFNAHVHAAWLTAHGDEAKPISQAAIHQATAVPDRTQRRYNRVARVQRQKNLEIGVKETPSNKEEAVWQHGRNSFLFVDAFGYQGAPGGQYRARRLPDSYRRRHRLAAKGRRRKINKSLTSLVHHEERGCPVRPLDKRYYANGGEAAKAANRRPDKPAYWPANGRRAGAWRVWHGVKFA